MGDQTDRSVHEPSKQGFALIFIVTGAGVPSPLDPLPPFPPTVFAVGKNKIL